MYLSNLARPTPSCPSPPGTIKRERNLWVPETKMCHQFQNVWKPTSDEDFWVVGVGARWRMSSPRGRNPVVVWGRADQSLNPALGSAPCVPHRTLQQLHHQHHTPPTNKIMMSTTIVHKLYLTASKARGYLRSLSSRHGGVILDTTLASRTVCTFLIHAKGTCCVFMRLELFK